MIHNIHVYDICYQLISQDNKGMYHTLSGQTVTVSSSHWKTHPSKVSAPSLPCPPSSSPPYPLQHCYIFYSPPPSLPGTPEGYWVHYQIIRVPILLLCMNNIIHISTYIYENLSLIKKKTFKIVTVCFYQTCCLCL